MTLVAAARPERESGRVEFGRLLKLLSFPTVSADPRAVPALESCARFLAGWLSDAGFEAQVVRRRGIGPPSVLARWRHRPGRPTVLLYGHYDVQPAGDVRRWTSDPFRPVQRNGRIVARGATDDKGPIGAAISALSSRLRTGRGLPVNVTIWVEGEEEIGSPHMGAALRTLARPLACDAILLLDSPAVTARQPRLITAFRGRQQLVVELVRRGGPVHSGNAGPGVAQPASEVVALAGRLEQTTHRGSSTHVLAIHSGPRTDRPTAAIPDRAGARIELRLAPGDDGESVRNGVRTALARCADQGLEASLTTGRLVRGVTIAPSWATDAAKRAVAATFGAVPVPSPSGGTIPFASAATAILRAPIVALGLTDPADAAHGPNESISLGSLARISAVTDRFLEELCR